MKRFQEYTEAKDFGHINEVAWPVILRRGDRLESLGTAVSIGRGVGLTAAHYFDQLTGMRRSEHEEVRVDFQIYVGAFEQAKRRLLLIPVINIFSVPWLDAAVLYLAGSADPAKEDFQQRCAHLDYRIPKVGTEVAVFGYRRARFDSKLIDGVATHEFHPQPTTSAGHIIEVHRARRDAVNLNFPCFLTDAPFDDGMSGGPVFDNATGRVIGLVCTSFDQGASGLPPTSYASLLWPVLGTEVQMRRPDLPDGSKYRLRELYEKKFMQATGWEPFSVTFNPEGKMNFHYAVPLP